MSKDAKACATTVHGGSFRGRKCSKPAKVQRNGIWYCTVHDPVRLKERRDASYEKWKAERDAERRVHERAALCVKACEGVSDDVLKHLKVAKLVAGAGE